MYLKRSPISNRRKGYTLIELMVTIILIVVFFGIIGVGLFYGTLCKGNFWYSDEGVLKAIQTDHPQVTAIIKSKRGIWKYSSFTVREGDNTKTYYLDSNILWNYTILDNEK